MRTLFLALLLFIAAPLYAQDARGGTQFGIGVRVTNVLVLNTGLFGGGPAVGGPSLLFPIAVSSGLRIEPELGLSSSETEEVESSQLTLGLGLLPTFRRGDFTLYTGGRLRYIRATDTVNFGPFDDAMFERSTTGFGVAPIVGGEHYFSRSFSLGAEAGVEYASFSLEQDDRFDGEEENVDSSSLSTQGSVFIRFYFN